MNKDAKQNKIREYLLNISDNFSENENENEKSLSSHKTDQQSTNEIKALE